MSTARPLIIAHRGGYYRGVRENTLEAFRRAIELGIDMIELDVHNTADGQHTVFHNQRVKGRRVGRLSRGELIRLAGFEAPTFAEVLAVIGSKVPLDIEIKNRGCIEAIVRLLQEAGALDRTIITSRLDSEVMLAKQLEPKLKTGLIVDYPQFGLQRRLERSQADYFVPWRWLWYSNIGLPKGYPVLIWTVNTRMEMQRLAADPRIAGIISNKPGLAIATI